MTLKLNLGAGDTPLPGYENLDRKTGQEIYPLTQYADNSVDEIRASHVLEHFSHRDVGNVLKEWTRVLKFGGTLKISVPDLEAWAKDYLSGRSASSQAVLMGGQADENDYHKAAFDRASLSELLQGLGYRQIRPWRSEVNDCAALSISLNIAGTKWYRIKPIFSVPRFGSLDAVFTWFEALVPLGLLPTRMEGPFWEQCLDRGVTQHLDETDLILCVDYDTPFKAKDITDLIQIMHDHPEIDAVAPIQMRRNGAGPLLMIYDDAGQPVNELDLELFKPPLTRIHTAHFGCTILRTSGFKKLKRPWFWSQPSPDGTWGDGRVDADIYFWKNWQAAGLTLYSANRVVVGHGEWTWRWPDESMRPIHQYGTEFNQCGKPAQSWR